MKNTFKSLKGITLVALVITIIILLILAGISISALTNTGIFGKAKDAKSKSELADAQEKITLLEHEWQMESASNTNATLGEFLAEKVKDKTIDSYEAGGSNYKVYIKGYVGTFDKDGKLVGKVEKAGPHPTISNITIKSEDGSTDVADNSQKAGTKLQINFSSSIKDGTIKSVTPAVPYTTNGTETSVTFTVVGTVGKQDYTAQIPVSIENKYKVATLVNANTIASATDTEKANNYYGKSVNYTSANGVTGWKIFYADSSNIYLIADDYVDVAKLPRGTDTSGNSVGNAPANTNTYYPKTAPFDNIFDAYSTGSARITTDTIKKLNKSFFIDKQFTGVENSAVNSNMKAVAYMLDTTAWSTFKDSNGKADYAIGGPTIEMLMKSYSQKHNVQYKAEAKNDTGHEGYKISKDNGENWSTSCSAMLSTSDSLYVPSSKGAGAMWVASPSAADHYIVMTVDSSGYVNYSYYNINYYGFRPLVCLKSNVQLQESGDGFSIK